MFKGLQEEYVLATVPLAQFSDGSKPSQIMRWLVEHKHIAQSDVLMFLTRNGYVWTDQSPWKLGHVIKSYHDQLEHERKCSTGLCTDDLNRKGFCIFSKSQSMAIGGSYDKQKAQGLGKSMPLYLVPPLSVLVRYVNAQGQLKNISLWTPSSETLQTRIGFLMTPQTKHSTTLLLGKLKSIHQDKSVRSLKSSVATEKSSYWKRIVQLPGDFWNYLFDPRSITSVQRSPFLQMSSSVKMYLHTTQTYGTPDKNRHVVPLKKGDSTVLQEKFQQVVGRSLVLPVITIQSAKYGECGQRLLDGTKHLIYLLFVSLLIALICAILIGPISFH